MMVSSIGRAPRTLTAPAAIAWVRARPWVYAYVVFALWALVPGLRRVVDWKSSFSSVSLVSILPLLALVPAAIAVVVNLRERKLGREATIVAWLWIGAFAYAYAVGIAVGNVAPATYTFLGFVLPMCFGLYLMSTKVDSAVFYERIASFALALSVPIALYAFYQYVAPPPWDVLWLQQTHYVSIGLPEAFAFRPFSTLNAPGPLGDFLMAVLILNLPRLRGMTVVRGAAMALAVAALALTLVRSNWIGLAVAALVYVALSPQKRKNFSIMGAVALAVALFANNATALLGEQAGAEIQQRFDSFQQITNDTSFLERQTLFGTALSTAATQPTGEGLGVVGTAAKLGSVGDTVDFDNGYIARFTEMGYFGTLAYLAAILAMLVATVRRRRTLERAGDTKAASVAAAAVAMQAALIFLDASSDHHAQLSGLFYWLTFALVFGRGVGQEPTR